MGAYSLPIIIVYWLLVNGRPPLWTTAISSLLLNIKFLMFFRVFSFFGKYFVIMIGVAKEVFPFLVVLFLIIFGFAHSFFILLRSTEPNDPNDPWNLATRFNFLNADGSINPDFSLIQIPDSNTNMFNWFPTSLLAMYLFLTGNN